MAGKGPDLFEFAARYPGTCTCCGKDFKPGTIVGYDMRNNIVVVDCPSTNGIPTEDEQAEARKNMCNECFLVHPGRGCE